MTSSCAQRRRAQHAVSRATAHPPEQGSAGALRLILLIVPTARLQRDREMTGTGKSDAVRFDEVQKVLRLALELRELPPGSLLQKRHAIDGLRSLVGAQVGVWAYVDGVSAGTGLLRTLLDIGWCGDAERRAFRCYVDREQWVSIDPSMPPLARAATPPMFTFTRDQLLGDRAWYGSEHVQGLRRTARVDSFIYTAYGPTRNAAVALSLHRAWGSASSRSASAAWSTCSTVNVCFSTSRSPTWLPRSSVASVLGCARCCAASPAAGARRRSRRSSACPRTRSMTT